MKSTSLIILTLCVVVLGCESTKPTHNKTPSARRPEVVTISHQPSWLLIGGKDVADSRGGDIIRVDGRLSGIMDFDILSYEPNTDPVTITFWSAGRIVYWKGKGEITKIGAGERVVVPLEK